MRINEAIDLITSIAQMVGGSVIQSQDSTDATGIFIQFSNSAEAIGNATVGTGIATERLIAEPSADAIRKKVLHVEDVDRAGDLIHYYLRNYFEVTTVNNGEDALLLVAKTQFNYILMDLDLGYGLDGFELTQLIRKLSNYQETPIIAITGRATKKDAERALASGCNAYLAKPFLKNDLLRLLEEVS